MIQPKPKKVRVHWNFHKKCYSVVDPKTGRVCKHTDRLTLKDATFVVRPAGRARVLREQKKNVHAFVIGNITKASPIEVDQCRRLVRYNPYEAGHFKYAGGDTGPITSSKIVVLDKYGVWLPLVP